MDASLHNVIITASQFDRPVAVAVLSAFNSTTTYNHVIPVSI